MDERDWVERFNRDLEQLLGPSGEPETGDAPEEHRQALELARRLKEADFSRGSRHKSELLDRLMPRAEARLRRGAWGQAWLGAARTAAWGALAVLLVALFAWTARNLIPVEVAAPLDLPAIFEDPQESEAENRERFERLHLELALPPGWAAAEGAEQLAGDFTGLVALNSWGALDFWAGQQGGQAQDSYSPETILAGIPSDGAYIVLGVQRGQGLAVDYGPEHSRQQLPSVLVSENCRESGDPAGFHEARFDKWGRRLRLEVYCGARLSAETARQVQAVLDSWRFDRVPAGDVAWASFMARALLPTGVNPAAFPVFENDGSEDDSQTLSARGTDGLRTARAELLAGQVVAVTFTYHWGPRSSSADPGDCPADACHWWRFEAWPDGQVGLVQEGGAPLPGVAVARATSSPSVAPNTAVPTAAPPDPLAEWSDSDEIRAHFSESWRLWDTLWAEALITTSVQGETQLLREQIWIDQPDRSLWLAGPIDGDPLQVRRMVAGEALVWDWASETRSPRAFDDGRLATSSLRKVLFPAWSLAQRPGVYRAVRFISGDSWEALLGRDTVEVEYTNVEGRLSDRFWVDDETGVILRWEHLPARLSSSSEETFLEILITEIDFNVQFPEDLFDMGSRPPAEFANDYQLDEPAP